MAETALTNLLEELKGVFKWYKNLLSGSENELQMLNDDLTDLKALLRDAGIKTTKEEAFKEVEWQIKEVVYDVQDTIDTCLTKATAAKEKNPIRRRLGSSGTRIRLAEEIKDLRLGKVKPVLDKVQAVFADPGAARGAEQLPPRPKKGQLVRRDKVVGFEDEEAKLIGYLTEETKELDVISIIGMPGLGKTTLALKIFENEKICYEFPIRIWVHVSQSFNSRDVFLHILRRFTSNDMSDLTYEELVQLLDVCLTKGKFLLVMDDVWSTEDLEVIQKVLPTRNGLSKVLITSREEHVGIHANSRRHPHMLRFLTLDECWKLLQLEVFGNVEDCPPELTGIGVEIAGQCYGVPLTVVVVGGILVDVFVISRIPLTIRKEWENVSKNMSNLMLFDREKRISDTLELSYNRLPDYLRECFLYTAVFPEDCVISVWMLTRLWIAEGFIPPKEGKTLEEIAEENLDDLISRNLLMVDNINPMGKIKTCRVQPMIRAFCRLRALEQNLFQEIKKSKEGVFVPPVSEVPKFCRLCIHSDINKFFSEKPNGPHVRSFLCFYREPVNLDPRYISIIPDAFNLLRVLESISIKFHQFPVKVTKLIHLRYITLHIDALTVLPSPLSQLWNLQTLVIETKSRIIVMKANMWRMYRLRNLKTRAAIVLDKEWEGEAGENLHTLSRLSPESCTDDVSKRVRNLKTLGIRGNLATLFETRSLVNFVDLETLKLLNEFIHETAVSENPLNRHPLPNCFPPNLKRLTLSNTFLEWRQMSTLASINTLEVIKLKDNAFVGIYWKATDDYFPSLQLLLIANLDLVHWEVSSDSFPSLRYLVIKNCENLIEVPGDLAKTLEKLDIHHLRKSAVDSARRIEQEKKLAQELGKVSLRVPFKLSIGLGCET